MGVPQVVLFWDYDTQWGADRSRAPGGPKNWGALEFENTERLLDLHAQYDARACFAVVGAAALPGERPYHDPEQIRRIHAMGHEIASHSLHHDWLPGLKRQELLDTLHLSKTALEQCIGAPVITFVPPYNQPFRYPEKHAPAFSERHIAGKNAVTISNSMYGIARNRLSLCPHLILSVVTLCDASADEAALPKQLSHLETISGLTCMRLNTPGGSGPATMEMLERSVSCSDTGMVVVYARPDSLHNGGPQDEKYLIPFFERVATLCTQGRLHVALPRDLITGLAL